jgi:hypothetical protein
LYFLKRYLGNKMGKMQTRWRMNEWMNEWGVKKTSVWQMEYEQPHLRE